MIAMNMGGTVALKNGISVTMVHAVSFLVFVVIIASYYWN